MSNLTRPVGILWSVSALLVLVALAAFLFVSVGHTYFLRNFTLTQRLFFIRVFATTLWLAALIGVQAKSMGRHQQWRTRLNVAEWLVVVVTTLLAGFVILASLVLPGLQ